MRKLFVLALLIFSLPTTAAMAQDEGLYDPAAPAGSAFVRFINAGTTEQSLPPSVNGKSFYNIKHDSVSPYFPIPAGQADVKLGTNATAESFSEGGFYTAVLKGDTLTILQDQPLDNRAKAMIAFYNLTDKNDLSLKTSDGKIEVVPPVKTGQSGYREANGVTINLATFEEGQNVADVGNITLKRGEAMAIIVQQNPDGSLKANTVKARTDTTG